MTDDKDPPLMHLHSVAIRASEPIPADVLKEHLAVALEDFKNTRTEVTVASPFADPTNVVFDDDVKTEEYTGPNAELPADPYPLTTRVIDYLKGRKRDG